VAAQTARLLQRSRASLQYLDSRADVRSFDAHNCSRVLDDVKSVNTEYAAVLAVSRTGDAACGASPSSRRLSFADREWFQQAMRTGAFTIGEPLVGRTSREPVVPFALPFRADDGRLDGLVIISARLAELDRSVRTGFDLPKGSAITVFSPRGTVIVRSLDADRWIGRSSAAHPLFARHVGASGIETQAGLDEVQRIYAFRTVPDSGWLVTVGVPREVALQPFTERLKRTLLIVAIGLLSTLLVAASIARRMRRSIGSLRSAARQASQGSWDVRAVEEGPPEIVDAAHAFNEMFAARARAEDALQARTRELEAANKELEAFAYSVSHDLRAPLRAVDGFSQVLLEDCAGRLDEEGRRYLGRIREGSQKMGELIDDMLKLSRATRGDLEWENVDITALAQDVLDELRSHEPDRDVASDIQPNVYAYADRRALRTLLVNLLSNAWKFTARTPAARIGLTARTVEDAIEVCVRDNGAGFDPAHATGLFTPFFRAHRADEFPGTGIGLVTVKRIVERLGGRVWVVAQPGRGASFHFTLPGPHPGSPAAAPRASHEP
jgi:signal transduction histidine kinase